MSAAAAACSSLCVSLTACACWVLLTSLLRYSGLLHTLFVTAATLSPQPMNSASRSRESLTVMVPAQHHPAATSQPRGGMTGTPGACRLQQAACSPQVALHSQSTSKQTAFASRQSFSTLSVGSVFVACPLLSDADAAAAGLYCLLLEACCCHLGRATAGARHPGRPKAAWLVPLRCSRACCMLLCRSAAN